MKAKKTTGSTKQNHQRKSNGLGLAPESHAQSVEGTERKRRDEGSFA
jgi:hypothetical protein